MFYDSENTRLPYYHMDPYQTVDGKVWRDWRLTDRFTLRTALTVENIFDRDFSRSSSMSIRAGPSRGWWASTTPFDVISPCAR
jgi:outer membrane receptor for ferrienterochelin and colicin